MNGYLRVVMGGRGLFMMEWDRRWCGKMNGMSG